VKFFHHLRFKIYFSKFSRFQIKNILIRTEAGVKNVLHGVDFQDAGFCQISRFFPDHPTYGRIFFEIFLGLVGPRASK